MTRRFFGLTEQTGKDAQGQEVKNAVVYDK
jgi:hypothetical protein